MGGVFSLYFHSQNVFSFPGLWKCNKMHNFYYYKGVLCGPTLNSVLANMLVHMGIAELNNNITYRLRYKKVTKQIFKLLDWYSLKFWDERANLD